MSPVTHLLLSWSVASAFSFERKDRSIVTVAGVVADMDGFGLLWDLAASQPEQSLALWGRFHHALGHNITCGLFLAFITGLVATRRIAACVATLIVFHLHLLCDLLGSRGPDEIWSIPYLLPFSNSWDFSWSRQWSLASWQNFLITAGAMVFVFHQAWRRGISPLEIVSQRANDAFVAALRARFGAPSENHQPPGTHM